MQIPLKSIALPLFALVAACSDDPPTPTEVRSRITSDLGHVLREASAAAEGGESLPGSTTFAMFDRMLGVGLTAEDEALAARVSRIRDIANSRITRRGAALQAPADGEESEPLFDADQVVSDLTTKLFTDANHKGEGIYQVPSSLVCTRTVLDPNGGISEEIDAECAADLATAQLRIRVSGGDTMHFAVQLGADHLEPVEIALARQSVAVTVDLDTLWKVATMLAPLVGEQLPNGELRGEATARLEILGTAHARGTLSIDRDVLVKLTETDPENPDPETFQLTSAKAKLLEVALDAVAKSGSFAIDVKQTLFTVSDSAERIELDLPGASAAATFAAGQPLQLTKLGLGDRTTTLSRNGARAVSIDVNPDNGRQFTATITADPAGTETLTVTPRMDIRTAFDHAVLGDERDVYDITRVLLDGGLRARPDDDRIEVMTGSLTLGTDPASYGFVATAGQCASPIEAFDATSEQYYTQWSVGACN